MRKEIISFILLIFLAIICFVFLTNASSELLSEDKALEIGVDKYLKFLWMVDGAFNSEKLNEDFTVNGVSLSKDNKVFVCENKTKKLNECIGKNFENEFKNLFSSSIDYEKVYSDGTIFSWISNVDGKYVFNNLDSCSINRMGLNHQLKVIKIENEKLNYEVLFENTQTKQINKRDFVLVLEDGEWKIKNAFYYDLCGIIYTIH